MGTTLLVQIHATSNTVEIISCVAVKSSDFYFFGVCVVNTNAFKYEGTRARSDQFNIMPTLTSRNKNYLDLNAT